MQKILLLGIDGAGKTALYQQFFLKKSPRELSKLAPTRGIARYDHDFLRSDFEIIDLGGGKNYRKDYIGNVELVEGLIAILFIVDVQAAERFQEAVGFITTWVKSVAQHLKDVKGYLLFNKIDPGMEGQLKDNLQQIAKLMAPLGAVFPTPIFKTITSIYTDSSSKIFQRVLLEALPAKRVPVQAIEEPFITKPVSVEKITGEPSTPIEEPLRKKEPPVVSETTQEAPPVSPPKISTAETTRIAPSSKTIVPPPKLGPTKSPPVTKEIEEAKVPLSVIPKKEEIAEIKERTAERLTDLIEASLDNNPEFVAIAVFSENAELIVGAARPGANQEILKTIGETLAKIDLPEYMSRLGRVSIGGEGHLKIGEFDIFFEKVSPDHLSTAICSSIEEETIKNILEINRYLNQGLSIVPDGVDEDAFRISDLMSELKMKLQIRGRSVDYVG